ncbi:hypothetical protein FACHB389_22585 [Nostoc calcicola FACHB-389]|nr:hypothetical protein FACHB389_22585 [Nostoc calcicola FACHB-389]
MNPLEKRSLGSTGLKLTRLGLGSENLALLNSGMNLPHAETQRRREQEFEILSFQISYFNSATPKI